MRRFVVPFLCSFLSLAAGAPQVRADEPPYKRLLTGGDAKKAAGSALTQRPNKPKPKPEKK